MTCTAVVAIVMAVSVGVGETASKTVEDAVITARVETLFLLNDHLSPFNINTTTDQGVVTLSGAVEDEVQKELAVDLAGSIPGVTAVVSRLTVMDEPAPERPKRGFIQRIEDRTLSASVRTRLLYHKAFKGLRIGVRTENNVVTLTGVVAAEDVKNKIAEVAADTRGVAQVVNALTVRPKNATDPVQNVGRQASDEWIEKRVETSILLNRHASIRAIDVEVDDGLCILTGTVDSEATKTLAESIAENIQGIQTVRNELRVRAPAPAPVVPADEALSNEEVDALLR